MGLDSVELVMRVEREFQIDISDAEARTMLTVGDMQRSIQRLLEERRAQGEDRPHWSDRALFVALQDIIIDEIGVKRERITPTARFIRDLGVN
jgi:acyl carrier protein